MVTLGNNRTLARNIIHRELKGMLTRTQVASSIASLPDGVIAIIATATEEELQNIMHDVFFAGTSMDRSCDDGVIDTVKSKTELIAQVPAEGM